MSIGNLKDTGNQGNNLPFQWKVLQGIQSVIQVLQSALAVRIVEPLGQQSMDKSVSTVLAADQANVMITPFLEKYTNGSGDTSGLIVLSISFASVGTGNALISVDGGMLYTALAPGETLNYDANGIMNFYNGNNFFWETTTNAGASLIVAYNYFQ